MATTRHGRRIALAGGAMVLVALVWTGCSVEKNYELLSFFFDGVPNPNRLTNIDGGSPGSMRESLTYTIHQPYAEQQCDACHRSMFDRSGIGSEVCLNCHSDVQNEYAYMHGPVAVGACLWCHAPHESAYAHLLKEKDRPVCTQCHGPAMLDTERVPAHADEERGCLECHTGHGSDARHQLRAGIDLSGAQGEG